jgi:hypothetical protein
VWVAAEGLERLFEPSTLGPNLVTGLGPVLLGVVVYVLLTRWLGVHEAEALWAVVRQRLGGARDEPKP